jgi:hypothetical protein
MRWDCALIQRLAGCITIFWQYRIEWYPRITASTRQAGLPLLHLAVAILSLLALDLLGSIRVVGIEWLID